MKNSLLLLLCAALLLAFTLPLQAKKVCRDSRTGKFVTEQYAKQHSRITECEHR